MLPSWEILLFFDESVLVIHRNIYVTNMTGFWRRPSAPGWYRMRTSKSRFCRARLFALLRSFSSLALSVILSPPSEYDRRVYWSRPCLHYFCLLDNTPKTNALLVHDWLKREKNVHGNIYWVIPLDDYHNTERTTLENYKSQVVEYTFAFDICYRLVR